MVVHGDDLIIEEVECEMRWVEATPRKKYIVKLRAMLGPERTKDKVPNILNRTVEFPRHVGKMLSDMELVGRKESVVPQTKTMDQRTDRVAR